MGCKERSHEASLLVTWAYDRHKQRTRVSKGLEIVGNRRHPDNILHWNNNSSFLSAPQKEQNLQSNLCKEDYTGWKVEVYKQRITVFLEKVHVTSNWYGGLNYHICHQKVTFSFVIWNGKYDVWVVVAVPGGRQLCCDSVNNNTTFQSLGSRVQGTGFHILPHTCTLVLVLCPLTLSNLSILFSSYIISPLFPTFFQSLHLHQHSLCQWLWLV